MNNNKKPKIKQYLIKRFSLYTMTHINKLCPSYARKTITPIYFGYIKP